MEQNEIAQQAMYDDEINLYEYYLIIKKNIKVSSLSYNIIKKDKEVNEQNNTLLLPMVY